jgi:hypothetical protein
LSPAARNTIGSIETSLLGAARQRRDLAQRLVCGGDHEALDELAAAASIEFLREGATGQGIGIVAKKPRPRRC